MNLEPLPEAVGALSFGEMVITPLATNFHLANFKIDRSPGGLFFSIYRKVSRVEERIWPFKPRTVTVWKETGHIFDSVEDALRCLETESRRPQAPLYFIL